MATYTSNYQLHQWVPEDDFLRTDFNTDFQKIDTALAGLASQVATKGRAIKGNYTGNGGTMRTVAMASTPKALLLSTGSSMITVINDNRTVNKVTIITNGFRVDAGSGDPNQSGKTYHYVAFL